MHNSRKINYTISFSKKNDIKEKKLKYTFKQQKVTLTNELPLIFQGLRE